MYQTCLQNRCKNEVRLCTLSYTYDSDFDTLIKDWSDTCNPHLTATITTPADVTLTQTYDEQSCQTLIVSCNRLSATFSSCSSSFTEATDLFSCRCGRDVLSLASECQIDGALQCEHTMPDTRTLWAVRFCSTTPTIPGNNGLGSIAPVTTTPGTPTMPLPTTSTRPLPPGSTSTPVSCWHSQCSKIPR